MADKTGLNRQQNNAPANYHDNGDGTYSEAMYSMGGTLPTGAATEAKQDTQIAVLGATNGAAVVTDANGTIQQYLRGIVKLIVAKLSVFITGAANIAIGQATAIVTSGVAVASRATRRSVTIRNTDAANLAYVGTGTVTSGNGFPLKAGESISIDTTAAINCIRDSADVVLAYVETYD